jgi:hypothetical protein
MHALVRFAHIAASDTFTTKDLHPVTAAALDLPPEQYRLSSLRYELSKLRAKGLVERVPHSRRYPLLPHGYRICLIFLKLFERVYAPLTAGLLRPIIADARLADEKRHQLDRLYQRLVSDLDALFNAILGGHLKSGHGSTLQNRPPRAWRPRPWLVIGSLSCGLRFFSLSTQRVVAVRMWESRALGEISKALWKPFCGFHGAVICIAIFGMVHDRADREGMLFPCRPADRRSLRLLRGRVGSAAPSNRSASVHGATRDIWFYFVPSSVRKSVWTLVRQLRGPHLRTCA